MTCYNPIHGFRGDKGQIIPVRSLSPTQVAATASCGHCDGCRRRKQADIAVRAWCEAQMHPENCFITVTFDPAKLPDSYSLDRRTPQLFLKRLRFAIEKQFPGQKISVCYCGEYGENGGRPHYHFLIFGFDFPDKIHWANSPIGEARYKSAMLGSLWTDPEDGVSLGLTEVGSVTPSSCMYVAGYVNKKCHGQAALSYYHRLHPGTGEAVFVEPEFASWSRRPALGLTWYEKFKGDCWPSGFIVIKGKKYAVPEYFADREKDRFTDKGSDPDRLVPRDNFEPERQRRKQAVRSPAFQKNSTPERLAVREQCAELRAKHFKREGL